MQKLKIEKGAAYSRLDCATASYADGRGQLRGRFNTEQVSEQVPTVYRPTMPNSIMLPVGLRVSKRV